MKKTICNIRTLAALLVAGAAFTACSNEDNYVEEAPQYYTMTVNATKDANTTRALSLADPSDPLTSALNATWTEGDEVTVTKGTTPVGTLTASNITNSGKTATFSGQIANTVQANDVLTLTYHPVAGLSAFENQTGTLASASDYDVAVATVTVTDVTGGVITISGSTTFYAQTAVVQLILEDASNTRINATSLKITAGIPALSISEDIFTFSPTTDTYTANGNGILYFALPNKDAVKASLAAKLSMSESTIGMVLPSATITFTASDGTNTYAASKTGYKFEARKYYGTTLTMYKLLSAATTSDYGKVVCAAGHLHTAKTAVPSGCTAVGILGKVTETGHGLILALQNATSQTWNTIDGWTSVTTYAGTTLKQLPAAALGTNLTSYTTLGSTTVSNWAVAQKSDYEAIFINLGTKAKNDGDGQTYDANVNAFLNTDVGGAELSGDYWSASGHSTDANYGLVFTTSNWGSREKTLSLNVRPVLGF